MRGTTSILIVVLITALLLGLYLMLLKPKFDEQIKGLETEVARYEAEQMQLARMQVEIPEMKKKLPDWRTRLGLYRKAIPEELDDDEFLRSLSEQIARHDVELLRVNVATGGKWLRDLDEKNKERLTAIGIDVEAAQQIEVAFYSVALSGGYDNVISTLEELKRYGRIYSIEQVNAPAGGAGGAVLESDNPDVVPLEVTGAIFFGIPKDFMQVEELYKQYIRSLLAPLASGAHRDIRDGGAQALSRRGRTAVQGADGQGQTPVQPVVQGGTNT